MVRGKIGRTTTRTACPLMPGSLTAGSKAEWRACGLHHGLNTIMYFIVLGIYGLAGGNSGYFAKYRFMCSPNPNRPTMVDSA